MVGGGAVEEKREGGEGRGGMVFEALEREGCSFAALCLWEGRMAVLLLPCGSST